MQNRPTAVSVGSQKGKTMTQMERIRRDNEQFRAANPWRMVNAQVLGQMCGRESTREAAIARAEEQGGVAWVNDDAKEVGFNGGCFC